MDTLPSPPEDRIKRVERSIAYYQRCAGNGDSSMRLGLYMAIQWRKLLDEPHPDLEELRLFSNALEGNADFHGSEWMYMSLAVKRWVDSLEPKDNRPQRWQTTIKSFQMSVEECHWNQYLMIELARWLADSEYASYFYPSIGMDVLHMSTVEFYSEQNQVPSVSASYTGGSYYYNRKAYLNREENFKVGYHNPYTKQGTLICCSPQQVRTALSALLLRCKIETEIGPPAK